VTGLLIAASGRWVAEDDTLDEAGDGNVVSHLSSDSEESQGRPSSLVAEGDGQRRRCNINGSKGGLVRGGQGGIPGCDSEDEQTVLTVPIIYRVRGRLLSVLVLG
jgi:hypothetical protein